MTGRFTLDRDRAKAILTDVYGLEPNSDDGWQLDRLGSGSQASGLKSAIDPLVDDRDPAITGPAGLEVAVYELAAEYEDSYIVCVRREHPDGGPLRQLCSLSTDCRFDADDFDGICAAIQMVLGTASSLAALEVV